MYSYLGLYAGEIYHETFFLEKTLNFFSYISEKTENQVRNEIFWQMSLTLTLPLDAPVRPIDAKGLTSYFGSSFYNSDWKRVRKVGWFCWIPIFLLHHYYYYYIIIIIIIFIFIFIFS